MKFKDFLKPNPRKTMIDNLLHLDGKEELINKLTVLQNEIGVSFDTKVIAVTSIDDDEFAVAFTKAFAETYAFNESKVLVVDANLYNPLFSEVNGLNSDVELSSDKDNYSLSKINDKISALCMKKDTYPSAIYRSGLVTNLIKENLEKFDHILVLVPSVKEHKEVSLLKEVINSTLLVTQRNITKKGQIFDALSFFNREQIPVSKVVILK